MIILALSLDRVQAPGLEQGLQATQYGAAEGACALPFTREGGGLWRWAGRQQNMVRGGFCSPAFKKF